MSAASRTDEIAGMSPADRAGASTGRSISGNDMSEGVSSRNKLAAGPQSPAALFGRRDPHAKRMFTAAEDAVFARLHAGEISITAAMVELKTGEASLKRHYHELYGKRLEAKRPVHIWTEQDRPALLAYRDGKTTLTTLCRDLHTSAGAIRKAVKDMNIVLPEAPKPARDHAAEPMVKGVWFAIAHKERSDWVQLDGAPMSIDEAQSMRDAGLLLMAQKRVNGGFDLMVMVKKVRGCRR